jgi:hypothetical protein
MISFNVNYKYCRVCSPCGDDTNVFSTIDILGEGECSEIMQQRG